MILYQRFERTQVNDDERSELADVDRIATSLRGFLEGATARLMEGHVHGAQSSAIQALIAEHLEQLGGFTPESNVLVGPALTLRPRADFYASLGVSRGIVVEVERGGTTTNNHDLKDVWKTHLAENAHHLFLVVPQVNFRADGSPRERPYAAVVRRLSAFFGDPRREVDIVSAHLFGY
ncbi:hypothetical protein [Agrococcus sp. Marseille-P2731]|uniref:hypothetical protein n=1 Tax=Agrococcus sp. Marseille-P2731 TaxID=1841862 RepID=UPI0009317750|nr:hypothetical protein [Agrococcus sp. Marseille-P2731]